MSEYVWIGIVIFFLGLMIFTLLKKSSSTTNDAQLNDHHRKILIVSIN